MDSPQLLDRVSRVSGVPNVVCELVLHCFMEICTEELSVGREVCLAPAFGKLVPKLRDNPGLNQPSPRTPKRAYYQVSFRPANQLKAALRVGEGKHCVCRDSAI